METANPPTRRWLRNLVIALAGLALLGLIGLGVKSLMGSKSGKPRKPPTVTLMPDKPPPPPPKEEKKAEPPNEDKKEGKVSFEFEPRAAKVPAKKAAARKAAG